MDNLDERFAKEAKSFDNISKKRTAINQIPDLKKEFYNNGFYNNIWRNSIFLQEEFGERIKIIIKELKKSKIKNVLEIGCGNGFLSLELARAGFNVTGIDLSQKVINQAERYLSSLPEKNNLNISYICENILNFKKYNGESVVCFGSLHHLPNKVLEEVLKKISLQMNPGQILIADEPRYDKIKYEIAILIYALRLILPNYFQYTDISKNLNKNVDEIFNKIREEDKEQSEMDNESDSATIISSIKKYFSVEKTYYSTSFYDKIIGSIRVDKKDNKEISYLLKRLDDLIVKYDNDRSQIFIIKAIK